MSECLQDLEGECVTIIYKGGESVIGDIIEETSSVIRFKRAPRSVIRIPKCKIESVTAYCETCKSEKVRNDKTATFYCVFCNDKP